MSPVVNLFDDFKNLQQMFSDWADTISDYRRNNFNTLDKDSKKSLKDCVTQLRLTADLWAAEDAASISDELNQALTQTVAITTDINKSYGTLANIQKGIEIASGLVALGQKIITKNPLEITESLKDLMMEWKA